MRQAKIVQVGEAAIDVVDPTDANEIAKALKEQDFKAFVVMDQEFEDEKWTYAPPVEEENDKKPRHAS